MRELLTSDASELAAAYLRNRKHLYPWNPVHPVEYYTETWQAADMARRSVAIEAGGGFSYGLFAGETVVGRFNLAGGAREELGLHRVAATTLLHNAGSQRVLLRAGFQRIRMAPRYLTVGGTLHVRQSSVTELPGTFLGGLYVNFPNGPAGSE